MSCKPIANLCTRSKGHRGLSAAGALCLEAVALPIANGGGRSARLSFPVASCCVPGGTCGYASGVTPTVAWPNLSLTAFGLTPWRPSIGSCR